MYKYRSKYRFTGPTSVSITWSQQYSAYAIKWTDTRHFQEMSPVINFIKSNPYGEYTYDPDNKVWYIAEKYIKQVITLLEAFGNKIFEVTFTEKPPLNYAISSKTISIESYLQKFRDLTGEDIKNLEYIDAKRIYRRVCLKFHPDRNPEFATTMSSVNEIWSELEKVHFKTRSQQQYETSSTN